MHLPAGSWYDVARGRTVKGAVDLHGYHADLGTVPLFVRLDSPDGPALQQALKP